MMLTSTARGMDLDRCRRLRVSTCLYKPVRRNELLIAIRRAMGAGDPIDSDRSPVCVPAGPAARALRILIAEDNRINQRVAISLVEHLGHTTALAASGREAVSLCAAEPFDLVLMDVQMPEMDGFTATARIREAESVTGTHIPILAVTAHAMQGDRERCLAAGMDGYVTKPLTSGQLAEAIHGFFPGEASAPPPLPESAADPHPVWDAADTLARLEADEDLLAELLEIFLDEGPRHLAALRAAIADHDPRATARLAHSLRGQLSYFGVAEASSLARHIEEASRFSSLEEAAADMPAFSTAMDAVFQAMRKASQSRAATGKPA
jgi:CheY-like chemotaxis protein